MYKNDFRIFIDKKIVDEPYLFRGGKNSGRHLTSRSGNR